MTRNGYVDSAAAGSTASRAMPAIRSVCTPSLAALAEGVSSGRAKTRPKHLPASNRAPHVRATCIFRALPTSNYRDG
jgi:hypothetical protein